MDMVFGVLGDSFIKCKKLIVDDLSPNPSSARRGEPEFLVPPSLAGNRSFSEEVRGLGF
jgi:hypothetical protein